MQSIPEEPAGMKCSLGPPDPGCDKKMSWSLGPHELGRGLECLSQSQIRETEVESGSGGPGEGVRATSSMWPPPSRECTRDLKGLQPSQKDVVGHSTMRQRFTEHHVPGTEATAFAFLFLLHLPAGPLSSLPGASRLGPG